MDNRGHHPGDRITGDIRLPRARRSLNEGSQYSSTYGVINKKSFDAPVDPKNIYHPANVKRGEMEVTPEEEETSPVEKEASPAENYEDSFEDLEWEPSNFVSGFLNTIQTGLKTLLKTNKKLFQYGILIVMFCLYNAYFIGAILYNYRHDLLMAWCEGIGFLIIITALAYWGLAYYWIIKKYLGKAIYSSVMKPINNIWKMCWKLWYFQLIFAALLLGGLLTFLIIDTKNNRRRLISAAGIPILILIGLVLSKHPARVVWRHIFWGTGLQFVFGLIILRWDIGRDILQCFSDKVTTFLNFTTAGSSFVFGYLATGYTSPGNDTSPAIQLDSVLAFGALSVIYFLSFVIAVLYSLGVMSWIIVKMGWLLQISIGTTAAESMSAAANIFLGMTEAPLVIKPYLKDLTNSELHSIMTGGFATIAGTVLGAFISFGVSPSHLLSASFMSAPAALAYSKLIYPETKKSKTTSQEIYARTPMKKGNILDVASEATSQAVFLVANIIASLVAITAVVACLDAILNWCGVLIGYDEFSFQWILGKVFYPLAFIIGIDSDDIEVVARLLGTKTVLNEFVAYMQLKTLNISARSEAITTYAICTFSNFSSIGIMLGGLGAMEPLRRSDLSNIVWRSFIAGNAAALMTACIAGTLID